MLEALPLFPFTTSASFLLLVREINIGFAASIILLAFLGMSPLASPFIICGKIASRE
jgi:hypothetical protein